MEKVRKPSKRTLKKWYDMTDDNYHAEVRVAIAAYFGDTINPAHYEKPFGFEESFKQLRNVRYNHCNVEILTTSNLLTKFMLMQIEKVYGKEVMESVNSCL